MDGPTIRPGRDEDEAAYIRLIGEAWAEYPGCVFDVDAELPELRALATHVAAQGGAVWVAEEAGRVLGMVCVVPGHGGAWEIRRMYVDAAARGSGLAQRLLATAEAHAAAAGAVLVELWTDTRFLRAHRFYAKCSYVRSGPIRVLQDLSHSIEYRYAKPLGPAEVWRLDAQAAASAEPRLAAILSACAAPPLAPAAAADACREAASRVAEGRAALFAGWNGGVLAGSALLSLDAPAGRPHRAVIAGLTVLPAFRRRGLGRALLAAAEAAAREAGRRILLVEVAEGEAALALCRAAGWTEAGRIPDDAPRPDGPPRPTVILYRSLA